MKKLIFIMIGVLATLMSCKKAIEPFDFNTNSLDPESGIVLKMIEIDSVRDFSSSMQPHKIVYFHVNTNQISPNFGAIENIDICINEVITYSRQFNYLNTKYSFYDYNVVENRIYSFILRSNTKESDIIFP